MKSLIVPASVRLKVGDAAADGLMDMFADAHALAAASFERLLTDELAKTRFEFEKQLANLRAELLKWCFLFWLGQVATIAGILSIVL
jgi:hypothetical protein